MKCSLFVVAMLAAGPLAAQDMKPNKDPVPSPSEMRADRGQDRPQGQAPEARTPSPADLAVERPRIDGDRPTDAIPDPRSAGVSATTAILENHRGEPLPAPGR